MPASPPRLHSEAAIGCWLQKLRPGSPCVTVMGKGAFILSLVDLVVVMAWDGDPSDPIPSHPRIDHDNTAVLAFGIPWPRKVMGADPIHL